MTDPLRWYGMTIHRTPLADRFWQRVQKDGPPSTFAPHLGRCWLWTGAKNPQGYGHIHVWVDEKKTKRGVHRVGYELAHGPIPDGLVLDHLCRVPLCVNPDHLEPVTPQENWRRGARGELMVRCTNGHLFTEETTLWSQRPSGTMKRICRVCNRDRQRKHRGVV